PTTTPPLSLHDALPICLPITSEPVYDTIVRYYATQQSYYPGKYVLRLFMKVLRLEAPEPDRLKMEPIAPEQEAELFIHVLTHARSEEHTSELQSRFDLV